ncbi:MAG: M48 family metalloprotease [Planctomycetota bacterium]|jgi:hypothetical protein
MIALLRAVSFLANLALLFGVSRLLGLEWPWALAVAAVCFLLSWWGCGFASQGETASPEERAAAAHAADLMGVAQPRFVRSVPGWTAAAVRSGRGYGLLVGRDVAPEHREAVLAHEMAHFATGDLFWEPFTDGPGRLLLQVSHRVPPLVVMAVPFLLLGAPLARVTELRADRLAARFVPSYVSVLREIAARIERRATFLYPSLGARIRYSARNSNSSLSAE